MKTSIPFTFLGLEAGLESAKFVVLPVPYDSTQSFRTGARFGPNAIIQASMHLSSFDDEVGIDLSGLAHTIAELEISKAVPEKTIANVEEAVAEVLSWKKVPVLLGGEHSITIGSVRAALKKYPKLSVLQVDAHYDLYDAYEGTKYSHACVMRRCRELCNCVQAGMREISAEEKQYIASAKPKNIFPCSEFSSKKISDIVAALGSDVYITFDLDAFKPELMPEVGNPVPGGLSWEDAVALLRKVFAKRNVVGFDAVELTPTYVNSNSAVVVANLVKKMIAYKSAD